MVCVDSCQWLLVVNLRQSQPELAHSQGCMVNDIIFGFTATKLQSAGTLLQTKEDDVVK